jgi:hypothetical protein
MTIDRDFKQRVRARMAKTGERYAAARRHLEAARARLADRTQGRPLGNTPRRPAGNTPGLGVGGGVAMLFEDVVLDGGRLPPRRPSEQSCADGDLSPASVHAGFGIEVAESGPQTRPSRPLPDAKPPWSADRPQQQ